ncbi:MAG: hypothetical protein ABJH45_08445 [Paracoccaceae bacterium]
MAAVHKIETNVTEIKPTDLHDGLGVEVFSSCNGPSGFDVLLGEATAMFSSCSSPEMIVGQETALFSSCSVTAGCDLQSGDVVELFSSCS